MTYFDDNRNRTLLAGLLVCLALLEIIFIAYGMEELYSPLYPALIELLIAAALPPLCCFADYSRRPGLLFVGGGCLLLSVFAACAGEWFKYGAELGVTALATPAFWLKLLGYLLRACLCVYGCGWLKHRDGRNERFLPLLNGTVTLASVLLAGEKVLFGIFAAACAALCAFLCEKLRGGGVLLGGARKALLWILFLGSCWALGAVQGGFLLTEEAACAFLLLLIFLSLILACKGYRLGLYLYAFLSLHMTLGYAGAFLRGDVDEKFLLGMLPFGAMALAGLLFLRTCPPTELKKRMETFRSLSRDPEKGSSKYDG